jgi:AcrR family transcriptional regulator
MNKRRDGECANRVGRPRCPGTDEAILRAALRQLATGGYARLSVEAVAAEAGTTKPTLYRRWPSKADLAMAALAHLQSQEQPEPTGSTEADLRAALRDFGRKLQRPNGMAMIGTLLVEERHTPELLALFRERVVRPRRGALLRILERARDRGELRAGADLAAAVNMLVGAFYARYLTGEGIPDDWADRGVSTILAGIRVERRGRPRT